MSPTPASRSIRTPDFAHAHDRIRNEVETVHNQLRETAERFTPNTSAGLTIASATVDAYETYGKWRRRAQRVVDLFDQQKRVDAGFDLTKDIADEYLVARHFPWVRSHPYFAIHAAHLRIFESAVRSVRRVEQMRESFDKASRAGQELREKLVSSEKQFGDPRSGDTMAGLRDRYNQILFGQSFMRTILDSAITREQLSRIVAHHGPELLAFWLYVRTFEGDLTRHAESLLGLLAMAEVEAKAVQVLYSNYRTQRNALQRGNPLDRIGARRDEDNEAISHVFGNGNLLSGVESGLTKFRAYVGKWAQEMDRMDDSLQVGTLLLTTLKRLQ